MACTRSQNRLLTHVISGVRRIMNQMVAIAPWLADSDRAALRAWSELELLTRADDVGLSEPDLQRGQ